MQPTFAPRMTGFTNADYFQQKIRQFEEEYDPASAAQLIAELGNRFEPEHIVTMSEIANDHAHRFKSLGEIGDGPPSHGVPPTRPSGARSRLSVQ